MQPPGQMPAAGSSGPIFGNQALATWNAGDPAPQPTQIIDQIAGPNLWLVQVDGPVLVDLIWGTSATKQLLGLQAPLRATIPGRCQVYVRPMAAAPLAAAVIARASCVPAYGGLCCQEVRQLVTAAAPTPIPVEAQFFFALVACTLTIGGVGVAVAAGSRVPLISGSTHNTGTGYLEFAP